MTTASPSLVARAKAGVHDLLHRRGSTRPAGILRIALAAMALSRWAGLFSLDRVMAPVGLVAFSYVGLAAFTLMLVGYKSRVSTAVSALVALAIAFSLNGLPGWGKGYSHHEAALSISIALLAFQPTGGSYSLDRYLAVRRAEQTGAPIPKEEGPLWAWPLMGLLISTIYFYGVAVKCHWGFVAGDRLEQIFMTKFLGSDVPRSDLWRAFLVTSSVGSLLLEVALCFGLWIRRYRWPLVIAGAAFHATIFATMSVKTFSLNMILMYLAFFDPDDVHRELDRVHRAPASAPTQA